MAEQENLHKGHRERLFARYAESGLESFSDVEVLELVLTYAIPRKDTNALAHRLLNTFGSLSVLLEAPILSVQAVEGMTRRAAALLHLIPNLWQRYSLCRQRTVTQFCSAEECGNYLIPFFQGLRDERVRIMCLDGKCQLLDCREVSAGSVNRTVLPIRRIVETALAVNASCLVVAHNHTSGIALPSREDVDGTQRLKQALSGVDIVLADHIIVADDDYVSMQQSGLL